MEKVDAPVVGALYRHFKGGLYRVQCMASCSETHEVQVVYRSVVDGLVWVRPASRFMEHVAHLGASVPRFERLHEGRARHLALFVHRTAKRLFQALVS